MSDHLSRARQRTSPSAVAPSEPRVGQSLIEQGAADPHVDLLRSWCASLFDTRQIMRDALTHQIDQPFAVSRHSHDDLVQFDLILGCGGLAHLGSSTFRISGTTAIVTPAGLEHSYELEPGDSPNRVYHMKLSLGRIDELGGVVTGRRDHQQVDSGRRVGPFALLRTDLGQRQMLAAAMRVVVRIAMSPANAHNEPMLAVRLAEAFCLWPQVDVDPPSGGRPTWQDWSRAHEPEQQQRGLWLAVQYIEQHLDRPPSVEHLARLAHYSPRHLTRRFQSVLGCSPHQYMTAQRLALAKRLLSQERLTVTQVARSAGFKSAAGFSRWFAQHANQSPSAYRDNLQDHISLM